MSTLSALIKNGQQLSFHAGQAALTPNDLIQIVEPAGEVYPVGTIDYDVNQSAASIVPETNVDIVNHGSEIYHRHAVVTDVQGGIYVGESGLSPADARLCKLTGSGASRAWQVILGTDSVKCSNIHIATLGNGTIAASFYSANTGLLRYGIVDRNGNTLVGATSIAAVINSGAGTTPSFQSYHAMIPLQSGGFAVAFQNSAGTAMQLATYDTLGVQVLAPTTIQTLSGTAGIMYVRLGQLANGNLVVVMRAPTSGGGPTPNGTTFVIVTTAGVSVKSNTVVDNLAAVPYKTGGVSGWPELNIQGNIFAIGGMSGATNIVDPNTYLAVYNAAGALQGSKYLSTAQNVNGSGTSASLWPQAALINDGLNFWMGFASSQLGSGVTGGLVMMTQAGVSTEYAPQFTSGTTAFFPSDGNSSCDMAIVGGNLVAFQAAAAGASTSAAPFFKLWQMPDPYLGISVPAAGATVTVGNVASVRGPLIVKLIPTGLSAIFVYDKQNVGGGAQAVFATANKVVTSAILGINQGAVPSNSQGTVVGVNVGATDAPINPLPGTDGTVFDHSAGTPHGNKGRLYRNGILQAGLSI